MPRRKGPSDSFPEPTEGLFRFGEAARRGRSGDLGALRSRIGYWAQLPGVRRGEMASILKTEGLAVNEATFDLWRRAVNGSMRA